MDFTDVDPFYDFDFALEDLDWDVFTDIDITELDVYLHSDSSLLEIFMEIIELL